MTREDAIYWIKNLAVLSNEKDMPQIEEALKMAIEALTDRKTEPQTEVIACPIIDDDAWIYQDEPQKCETCKHYDAEVESIACERCLDGKYSRYEPLNQDLAKNEPTLVKDLVKAFCEDGTWLERQGVYTLTLAEAKQRAVDIIESVLAKDEPQTDDKCKGCIYENGDSLMACVSCYGKVPYDGYEQDEPQTERSK